MQAFKCSLVLRTRENTDVFIILDGNIYGIHSQRVNILYLFNDVQRGKTTLMPCANSKYPD